MLQVGDEAGVLSIEGQVGEFQSDEEAIGAVFLQETNAAGEDGSGRQDDLAFVANVMDERCGDWIADARRPGIDGAGQARGEDEERWNGDLFESRGVVRSGLNGRMIRVEGDGRGGLVLPAVRVFDLISRLPARFVCHRSDCCLREQECGSSADSSSGIFYPRGDRLNT